MIKAARTPADGVEAVDISKPDSIASLFARIGTVDGIICAAGSAPMVPWSDVTTQVLMAGLGGKFADQANVIIGGYPHVTLAAASPSPPACWPSIRCPAAQ